MGFKKVEIQIAGLRHFLPRNDFFFCFFFILLRFWSSLGVSWEPSWVFWVFFGRAPDSKTYKNQVFLMGFEKAVYWSLKLLMSVLGSSCFFLVKSGAKLGFQNGYQKWRKKESKNREAINSNNLIKRKMVQFLVPFWTSFGDHFEAHFGTQNLFKMC